MEDKRTLGELASEAIQVQQVVNLSGLIFGWAKAMKRFNELCPDIGTDKRNKHPIHQMWASAICDLMGIRQDSMDGSFITAYNACRAIESDERHEAFMAGMGAGDAAEATEFYSQDELGKAAEMYRKIAAQLQEPHGEKD